MTLEVDLTYVKGNKVVPNVSDDFDPFSPPTPSEYAPSEPSLDSESNNSNDTDHMLQEYMDGENVEEEDEGSGWEGESDGSCTKDASASGVITNNEDDRDRDQEGHEEVSDGTTHTCAVLSPSHASHSSIIATSRPKRLASQGLQVFLEAAKNCGKSLKVEHPRLRSRSAQNRVGQRATRGPRSQSAPSRWAWVDRPRRAAKRPVEEVVAAEEHRGRSVRKKSTPAYLKDCVSSVCQHGIDETRCPTCTSLPLGGAPGSQASAPVNRVK